MLSRILSFFDTQEKTLKRYHQIADVITSYEPALKSLDDDALKAKTTEFKERFQNGESLEELLPEAYAVIREAARRSLGLRHFDVQLIAGIAFHEGKVAEQKTGEGKTLSATLPLYLNSLAGRGAHLVTVNDYLSQVGAGWMGPIYQALGVSVGVIIHDQAYLYDSSFTGESRGDERLEHFRPVSRQEAYRADVTYGTNNEFGFDYLRDNMAQRKVDQVQRDHAFAIVDEADSILIDEARTPLIISAPDAEPTDKYQQFAKLVQQLAVDTDYTVDEKMKTAVLTEFGVRKLERLLGVQNLYEESFDTIHHAEQALKAATVYNRDRDYVVREGEVIIVDEHTGRLMIGRRYSDGLHQAIEAKEGVAIQQESRTLATISLQNYFRLYDKLAGMSGTAKTESEEFLKIYDMEVVSIPTNKTVQRNDVADVIFKTMRAKFSALVQEIETVHTTGRPILIGTRSIDQNQVVSKLLTRKGIEHVVLNAKNHEREAFIIAEAGKKNAITVATNIAGRGVDIVLGGAAPERREFEDEKAYQAAQTEWQKNHDEVVALGGLHIVGTERHESRRIDNQLRGRAGRQGDPGSSRFYISLEDEIMRIFGGEQISKIMDALHIDENLPIEHPLISKALAQAQMKVEGYFFDQRKNLVQYDDVMNRQREIIYRRRQNLLDTAEELAQQSKDTSKAAIKTEASEPSELAVQYRNAFVAHFSAFLQARWEDKQFSEVELENILVELGTIIPLEKTSIDSVRAQIAQVDSPNTAMETLLSVFDDISNFRRTSLQPDLLGEIERAAYLSALDEQWMHHLDDMTHLRDTIWLRGGKEQALAEYKKEAFALFEKLIARIELEALRRVFRMQVVQASNIPSQIMTSGPAEEEVRLLDALTNVEDAVKSLETMNIDSTPAAQNDTNAFLNALKSTGNQSGSRPAPQLRAQTPKAKGGKKKRKGTYV